MVNSLNVQMSCGDPAGLGWGKLVLSQ